MARHSLGSIVALSSDIAKWVFVTAISVAPMAALTCSGASNNPGSAVSARGGAVVVVVVDLVVAAVLASMGLYMLPPSLVAMPLKLIVFVLADGWLLVASMLLKTFAVA